MIGHILTLKQLEALVWVVDLGSFRKAAEHLNTTQPNISARIAGLETTLGIVLMSREGGTVRMTQKGLLLLEQARIVLRDAEAMLSIAGRPDLVTDRLRLGVTEMVACTWLRPYLRAIKGRFPKVSVELTVDMSHNLDKALQGNALDLAIQNAPFASEGMGTIALGSYPYVWVAAPQAVRGFGATPTPAQLLSLPVLTHARHTRAYRELVEHFDTATLPRSRIVPSSSLTSSLHMALDGMGVAVVLHAMVRDALAEGALVTVDPGWHPQPLQFAARYPARTAAGFMAHCAELARAVAVDHRAGIDFDDRADPQE